MRDMREIRYYASIPKLLLAVIGCGAFVVVGWDERHSSNLIIVWLVIVICGLGALIFLILFVDAIVLHQPLLVVNAAGVTARRPPMFWKKIFVPWTDTAHMNIRTDRRSYFSSSSTLQVRVFDRDLYDSAREQRLDDGGNPLYLETAISLPLTFVFLWASRKRCLTILERIKTTFAPEILQYDIVVDEKTSRR